MNPHIIIAGLILALITGSAGLYLTVKNFLIPQNEFQEVVSAPTSSLNKSSNKFLDKPPLQWIKNEPEKIESKAENKKVDNKNKVVRDNIIFINKAKNKMYSVWQQITASITPPIPDAVNPVRNLISNGVESDIPFIPDSEMNIQSAGPKTPSQYYENFVDSLKEITFTDEEAGAMKKDLSGRIFSLEELIEEAVSGGDLAVLKSSFSGWQNLDERVLIKLKNMPVNFEMVSLHRSLLGWYSYHSAMAKKFSEPELNNVRLAELENQFKKNAEIHLSKFHASLTSLKTSPNFVSIFIPEAQAVGCGGVNFGGRLGAGKVCWWGTVITVSPPCPGVLLFSYVMVAANPYLSKNISSGTAVLGKMSLASGCCVYNADGECWPYQAVVLYFGSSGL